MRSKLWWGGSRVAWGRVALAVASALVMQAGIAGTAQGLTVPQRAAAPKAILGYPVPGSTVPVHRLPERASAPNYHATATHWPAASAARVTLGKAVSRGKGSPVWGQAQATPKGGQPGPTSLDIRVLGHKAATAAGTSGVLAQVTSVGGGRGPVRVGFDYSSFAQAFGGDYAQRLRLVELPACALTTPQVAACRVQTPLATTNDTSARSASATVTLGGATPSASTAQASAQTVSQSASMVLALTTSTSSGDGGSAGGQYGATSLSPSGTWSEGGSSGSFTYTYPITAPPAVSSMTPKLSLDYDSGSVDGKTAATQAQGSWIGDGWSMADSFIEQSFEACSGQPEGKTLPAADQTGDMCYDGPILTLSLNGSSLSLLQDSNGKWHASDDKGEVVTHVINSGNGSGTYNTDYWTITERDGTVYQFGRNELKNWVSGKATTHSVDTEPVYSSQQGDPCYNATFTAAVCTMAYRWHLDYVSDLHGNAMAYYYQQDTNYYAGDNGAKNGANSYSYVRDSHLDHIDYGFTNGNAYGTIPDKIAFATGDRCVSGTCDPLSSNSANWPDVPYDLVCAKGATCTTYGPGYFSTVRLTTITTEQWNGTGGASPYNTVDSYQLKQSIPTTGTYNTSTVRLDEIDRTGQDTTAGGSTPPVLPEKFGYTMLANRVNYTTGNGAGLGPMNRYRLNTITTEGGSVISITYGLVNACTPTSIATLTPSSNTASCFPVEWSPANGMIVDWFNKYVVQSVSQSDPSGGSAGLYTQYLYPGGQAAWHYDDNELVKAKYRTYGQWRGYGDVQTLTGQGTDPVTESETWYYRGMDGDWLSSTSTRSISIKDSQNNSHVDSDQLAGDVLESAAFTYNGGTVDHSTINSYWVSPATATRTRTGLPSLTANAVGQVEIWGRQAITSGATATWRTTETDTSYDANAGSATFGLPLYVYSHGDLSLASPSTQETCVQTTYAPANTSLNLVGLVAETETDDKPCGGTSPAGSSAPTAQQTNALTAPTSLNRTTDVIADTRTFYDNPTMATTWPQPTTVTWPQAAPTLGVPSVVQVANGYNGTAFTYQTKSTAVFDTYGRPTAAYDGDGHSASTTYTDTAYLTTTAVKATNALGQSITTTLDPERALTLSVTDANNVVTTVHADGLGRTVAVWNDSRTTSSPANELISYTFPSGTNAPVVVTEQTLNDESGYSIGTTLYDALLRVRQTQAQAISTTAGRIINDTFYDTHGWTYKTNVNYQDNTSAPNGSLFQLADNNSHQQTLTSYDGLGRPTVVTSLDDSTVKQTSYAAYLGDRTISVPPTGGTATATIVDAIGRTTETDQYATAPSATTANSSTTGGFTIASITGGNTQATTYTFNPQGRPWQTVDPNGATWATSYNFLGQPVTHTDPDAGTSAAPTVYDPAGNVLQATNSANISLSYVYDKLNRKIAEYDATTAGQSSANEVASWVYDNSNNQAGVTNPIGHVTTATSYTPAGAFTVQAAGFNIFGESLGETYTVPGSTPLATNGPYVYQHDYTTILGLPLDTLIPAAGGMQSEVLSTGYCGYRGIDEPCTLGGTNGYVQNVTYTALGQVAQQTIGSATNQALVTNTFDPHTGALADSNVVNTALSATPMDDTSYGYDASGNTTAQTDVRNGSSTETQCYTYDPLDRLTGAWTTSKTASSCTTQPTAANVTSTVGDGITGSAYWTSWDFTGNQGQTGQPHAQTQHDLTGSGTDTTTSYTYGGSDSSCTKTTSGIHTLATATTAGASVTTSTYCYDGLGNTTSRTTSSGQQNLTWNDEGKLYTATTGANTSSYYYDADGNVIERADPNVTTLFLPDQQITYFTGQQALNAVRSYALPGGGQAVLNNANYSFVLSDRHGTASVSLDATAKNPSWQQTTPYGAPRGTAPGGSWVDPNGFLDKPQDTSDQLTTIGARQYDTTLGRFISLDPILEAGTQQANGYTYAGANPITGSDPTGLMQAPCMNDGACGTPASFQHNPTANSSGTQGKESRADEQGGIQLTVDNTGSNGASTPMQAFLIALKFRGVNFRNRGNTSEDQLRQAADKYNFGYGVLGDIAQAMWLTGATTEQIDAVLKNPCTYVLCGFAAAKACVETACDPFENAFQKAWHNMEKGISAGAMLYGTEGIGGIGEDVASMLSKDTRAAAACFNSFAPQTEVLLANGKTEPIKDLKVGDQVEAADPSTGQYIGPRTVLATIVHHDDNLLDVTINTGHDHIVVIHTTTEHPFWDATRAAWVNAADLTPGHALATTHGAGTPPIVVSVTAIPGAADRYNLTIQQLHTYYVLAGDAPILVHNSGDNPWDNAHEWSKGYLPKEGGPSNGVFFKRYPDADGALTGWGVYDENGRLRYRVDLFGATHGGVETPHWQTYALNPAPNGKIFVNETGDAFPGDGPFGGPPTGCVL